MSKNKKCAKYDKLYIIEKYFEFKYAKIFAKCSKTKFVFNAKIMCKMKMAKFSFKEFVQKSM